MIKHKCSLVWDTCTLEWQDSRFWVARSWRKVADLFASLLHSVARKWRSQLLQIQLTFSIWHGGACECPRGIPPIPRGSASSSWDSQQERATSIWAWWGRAEAKGRSASLCACPRGSCATDLHAAAFPMTELFLLVVRPVLKNQTFVMLRPHVRCSRWASPCSCGQKLRMAERALVGISPRSSESMISDLNLHLSFASIWCFAIAQQTSEWGMSVQFLWRSGAKSLANSSSQQINPCVWGAPDSLQFAYTRNEVGWVDLWCHHLGWHILDNVDS